MTPRHINPLFRRLGDMAAASRRLGDTVATIPQLLAQAAARYGLDPALILAQAQQESGLRNVVNPKSGACGVLQLMPSTAAQYGVSNCLDAAQNIDAGVHYLADLLGQFGGDVAKALAAYDWGPGNLAKAIAQWGDQWLAHVPAETKNYVASIAGISPMPQSSPEQTPPLTIDAATGQVIPNAADISTMPYAAAGISTPKNMLLLTALGVGAYLLADLLSD